MHQGADVQMVVKMHGLDEQKRRGDRQREKRLEVIEVVTAGERLRREGGTGGRMRCGWRQQRKVSFTLHSP